MHWGIGPGTYIYSQLPRVSVLHGQLPTLEESNFYRIVAMLEIGAFRGLYIKTLDQRRNKGKTFLPGIKDHG